MRMNEMNKLFEEQGFAVERKYVTELKRYDFCIGRDGKYLYTSYTYPVGARPDVAGKDQREFVYKTIKDFERDFGPKRKVISYSLQTSFMELLTDFCHRHQVVLHTEMNLQGDRSGLYFRKDGVEEYIEVDWQNIISCMDVLTAIDRRLIDRGMIKDTYQSYKHDDRYCALADALSTKYLFANGKYFKTVGKNKLEVKIKDIIFSPPATIVKWDDGTKTVVKVQNGEDYDPEKGLAMAISKKALGNKREYYHTFLHWLKKYEKQNVKAEQEMKFEVKLPDMSEASKAFSEMQQKIHEQLGIPRRSKYVDR